jgi:hypothetical protein
MITIIVWVACFAFPALREKYDATSNKFPVLLMDSEHFRDKVVGHPTSGVFLRQKGAHKRRIWYPSRSALLIMAGALSLSHVCVCL